MNKSLIACLLLLITITLLFSKTIEEEINNKIMYLELFPDDLKERYELAYLYNLMNQLVDAESQYRYIINKDSLNTDAWIGYLWSMSLQEKHHEVLSFEDKALLLTQKNPSVMNIMAFTHGSLNSDYEAIYYYREVLKDNHSNQTELFLANKGVAGHYFWTGDYYQFNRINKAFNQLLPEEEKQNLMPIFLYMYSGISYGYNDKDIDFQTFNQWVSLGALEAELIVENKRVKSQQTKTNYTFKLDNYFYPVNLSAQFHLVKNDQRHESEHKDGYACQFSVSKPFYPYKSKLEPYFSLAFFDYDSFDSDKIGQVETGAYLYTDLITTGLSYSQSRYPKDHRSYTLDIHYKLKDWYAIQLINGFGDNNNMISMSGQIFDEWSSTKQFHQINHYFYWKRLIGSLSYNRSLMNRWSDSWMMSAGIRY
ncbi:MAG: hypothetical protein KA886_02740 [Candidatus Cloacimonetes bacterium]|nr:hypothetical protein [Candidatus Cloacimonadota bacterium]